ncbi:hypothetical protein PIB30_050663 [Stylosanthes scabra]|uniref:Uncharacterized protein n=1 Tax=Stylosanthes scabra TaxID=79078 RepID=A0ABU6XJA7_9FABA|nr:hypothetical protein [Stylosanthes scabra]
MATSQGKGKGKRPSEDPDEEMRRAFDKAVAKDRKKEAEKKALTLEREEKREDASSRVLVAYLGEEESFGVVVTTSNSE